MISKNKKIFLKKYDYKKKYTIDKAIEIVKDITYTKFDSSLDLSLTLDLNFRKSEHIIEDFIFLPHGKGKRTKILVICTPEEENQINNLDVDYFGFENYIDKIKSG
jgi:large subunit ribosomal protein L1